MISTYLLLIGGPALVVAGLAIAMWRIHKWVSAPALAQPRTKRTQPASPAAAQHDGSATPSLA